MIEHSDESRKEYTEQVQARWDFLQQNLLKREKRLALNKKFLGRLPGLQWTITRQLRGITKVKGDILDLQMRIDVLLKRKEINGINLE